jgi:hypothetical protein
MVPITFNAYRLTLLEQWREIIFSPEAAMSINMSGQFGVFDKAFCFLTGVSGIPYMYLWMCSTCSCIPASAYAVFVCLLVLVLLIMP